MNFPEKFKKIAKRLAPQRADLHNALQNGDEKSVEKFLMEELETARETSFCGCATIADRNESRANALQSLYLRIYEFIQEEQRKQKPK